MTRFWSSAGLLAGATLFAVLTTNSPASALEKAKWSKVCVNFLGLRSGASGTDTKGAGYGMDDGNTKPLDCLKDAPANWDAQLKATLESIKEFPNSGDRYLLIVHGCPGLSRDYSGAFPKCNAVSGAVHVATPNTLSHYTADQLVTWVVENI